jgi:hypothetical protein
VVEHCLDTAGVTGSNPVSRTILELPVMLVVTHLIEIGRRQTPAILRRMKPRVLCPLVFVGMALSFASCATQDVMAKASGQPGPLAPPNQPPSNPNAAYYALVPLTVPFDLLTWPIQYFYMQGRTQSAPSGPSSEYQSDEQYLRSQALSEPYYPPSQGHTY